MSNNEYPQFQRSISGAKQSLEWSASEDVVLLANRWEESGEWVWIADPYVAGVFGLVRAGSPRDNAEAAVVVYLNDEIPDFEIAEVFEQALYEA